MKLIGQFVDSKTLGLGKITGYESGEYLVDFFISPWKRNSNKSALKDSMAKPLPRQTRVFVEQDGKWRMGRIHMEFAREEGGYDYEVRFPNGVKVDYPGEQLFARCLAPFDDPTSMLANGAMETQYWHDRRADFTSRLLAQRAASRGLYSLLSSSIELVPHQVEVARRVLEDPLQRYVLADEVGMGKTIEAGLILRQFLLTDNVGVAWVIVPTTLVKQWRRELRRKFSIDDFRGRVEIYSFDQMYALPNGTPQFIIVDEAHHIVSETIPEWLVELGGRAERLLLLTATPSLVNSKVLLHLLQLIDPGAYSGVQQADFDRRLEQREQLGIFLRGFRADTAPALLRQRLKQLAEQFQNDFDAQQMGLAIARSVEENDKQSLRLNISHLRSHIADVYRIHQRLIRTRRRDAASWVFRPRGPIVDSIGSGDLSHVLQTWTNEDASSDMWELLEQWRIEAAITYQRGNPERITVRQIFISLFNALSCGCSAFARVWDTLPAELRGSLKQKSFVSQFQPLQLSAIMGRSREVARAIGISIRQFSAAHGKSPRVVIFGSDPDDLSRCAEALRIELGRAAILLAESITSADEDIASKFESDPNAKVLLCGIREEEGLNLHFADFLVHLDLPFSPERIEQRIGRLDRFGRKADYIKQRIVLPGPLDENASYWDAWLDLIADGFHIFNTPLTDMQFLLSEITEQLADAMFEDGAAGLRSSITQVQERLQIERDRLDNQYALDQVLQDEEGAALFCQHLEDVEADEDALAESAKRWFVDCLKFRLDGNLKKTFTLRWDGEDTLLPVQPWGFAFRGSLPGPKTFSRKLSNSSESSIQLLRVGSPLFVAAERHLQWEDRGTAFATWRLEPSIGDTTWFAFKLCYQIEGNLPPDIRLEERFPLRARIDGYLPPWVETLYVGSDLSPITDPTMIEILSRPYVAGSMTRGDLNLGSRPELLQQVIDANLFSHLCREVRSNSENWLINHSIFQETINASVKRGTTDLSRRLRRLQMRQTVLQNEDSQEVGLQREIELNKLLVDGLNTPKIRLDSIGVIVVSGHVPHEHVSG